jgi:hypothetical protein
VWRGKRGERKTYLIDSDGVTATIDSIAPAPIPATNKNPQFNRPSKPFPPRVLTQDVPPGGKLPLVPLQQIPDTFKGIKPSSRFDGIPDDYGCTSSIKPCDPVRSEGLLDDRRQRGRIGFEEGGLLFRQLGSGFDVFRWLRVGNKVFVVSR